MFRTRDGGHSWQRVLFVNDSTGVSDITMDPRDSHKLIAGTWQIDIKTWGRNSGGNGSGVFVTNDGGDTWTRVVGHGLPASPLGKIAVAIAPSDPERVYALIETGERGSLWRSDDGGANWRVVNYSRLLNERPHYYTRILVMPDNENEVYFPSNGIRVTHDGGATVDDAHWAGDNHDMWADPSNPNRMMIGSDIGVLTTTVRGKQWNEVRLPIAQMYHVATDNRVPYRVFGQMQDGMPLVGPSNFTGGGSIPASEWTTTAGCETGWSIPDTVSDGIVWGGCYAGVTESFDSRSGFARSVSVWPDRTMGANAGQVKLRMNWTYPIAISPFDHNTVYVGSQYVHRTTDGGKTWTTISPDLTLNDKSMMGNSGGLTIDNLSVEYAGVVFAIEESPVTRGLIWAGTNDGQLQVTRDGGAHWDNVTRNITRASAEDDGSECRSVAVRRGNVLRRFRWAPGGHPRSISLPHDGLRQDVEEDHDRHPAVADELHERGARRSRATRTAVRWNRERAVRLVRRRRPLVSAAAQPSARPGSLDNGSAALS